MDSMDEIRATRQVKRDPFNDYLEGMKITHQKKGHDYATTENQYQNFDRQQHVMGWFVKDRDKVFAGIIAQKLARLATLLNGKEPKNESIADSFEDAANYILLWRGKIETEGQ